MNHCHILWNILYTISLLYGLFNFLPQSSLATGKSSVSREIFRIPRGNLFLSFGQQREAFLPYYDGYSCVFGRTRVCSVDRPLRISRGISKIVLLTAVFAAFSWRTARKPDRCFFFFSDPQFLLLDFQTRIIPLDERGIEHFLPLFDPPSDFSLHVCHPLYASSVCGAHENRKGNVFVDFEQRRLFIRAN